MRPEFIDQLMRETPGSRKRPRVSRSRYSVREKRAIARGDNAARRARKRS